MYIFIKKQPDGTISHTAFMDSCMHKRSRQIDNLTLISDEVLHVTNTTAELIKSRYNTPGKILISEDK